MGDDPERVLDEIAARKEAAEKENTLPRREVQKIGAEIDEYRRERESIRKMSERSRICRMILHAPPGRCRP